MRVQIRDVDPGVHDIVLKRGDTVVAMQKVSVGGDASRRVDVTIDLHATQGTHAEPEHRAASEGGGSLGPWWAWATGAGAVATVVAVVLIAGGGSDESPVEGDTDPPVVRGVVSGTVP